jgi:hypothetical protein
MRSGEYCTLAVVSPYSGQDLVSSSTEVGALDYIWQDFNSSHPLLKSAPATRSSTQQTCLDIGTAGEAVSQV